MNQKVKKNNPYADQNRYGINRQKRIARHLKKFPNDAQAQEALANSSANNQPTRKASKEKSGWLTSNKGLGELIKSKFTGTVTKKEAGNWAKFIKLSKKVLFWQAPVVTYDKLGAPVLTMKHTNKLSNFKGKIKAKTAELKAAAQASVAQPA